MISSYLSQPEHAVHEAGGPAPQDKVLIELKRTHNARDIRDSLLALTYALSDEGRGQALCVLLQSRLSEQRLRQELERFRSVTRPELTDKVFLVSFDGRGKLAGELPADVAGLEYHVRAMAAQEMPATRRVTRQAVKAHLVNCWLAGWGAQTVSKIRGATGASYPTVAAALVELRELGLLNERELPAAQLREPAWEAWRRLAEGQLAERRTLRFVDPSGLARTPAELASRLQAMQSQGKASQAVRIGGVLGADHYDPDIDISAAPRLDLHLEGGDWGFMRRLDAALVEASDPKAKTVVAVHLKRTAASASEAAQRIAPVAPALDCLADLLEMGYQAEARNFAAALVRQRSAPTEAP